MRFHYDKRIDALYIRFDDKKRYHESNEVAEGVVFDYDRAGRIIGMEILDASKKMPADMHASFGTRALPAVFDIARGAPVIAR